MLETVAIALETQEQQPNGVGDGLQLKARSNYGAAQDPFTHLHLWLNLDHRADVTFGAAEVERLDRAFGKMGLEGVKRALLPRLDDIRGLEPGRRSAAVFEALVGAFKAN